MTPLTKEELAKRLTTLGENLPRDQAEILIVGAAAGLLTGELGASRTTIDCDVIRYAPPELQARVERTAQDLAEVNNWAKDWFNSRVMELDILPAGWRSRRRLVGSFGSLTVYALGRLDLLATKFFASRPQDRQDIREMRPTGDELWFIRRYMEQMRLPSRQAHLDDLQRAMMFLESIEAEAAAHG